jgi:HlyD family secretion protein
MARQTVQHRDGGVVSAYVQEGQQVKAGQILLELNGGEVVANGRRPVR